MRRAAALFGLVLSGCSLSTLDWTPCVTDADCHDAFGLGSVCDPQGLCEDAPDAPRCEAVEPPGWLDDAPLGGDVYVVGALDDIVDDRAVDRSFALAVRQIDESGGLGGQDLVLARCDYHPDASIDEQTREQAALAGAGWLRAALGAQVILGPSSSALVGSVWEAYGDQTLLISPSATSPALTFVDGLDKSDETPGTLWRTAPPDSLQGSAIADDLLAQHAPGVAIVVQTGPYGDGLADTFVAAFQDADHAVQRFQFDSQSTLTDAITNAGQLSESDYPWVLFISSDLPDAVAFLNAAAVQSGYATRGIFLTDGAADVTLLQQTQSASALYPNIRGTRPWTPTGPVYEAYRASYAAAYDGEDPAGFAWTANAYDAGWLAAYALTWVNWNESPVTPDGMARGLRRISAGAPVDLRPSGWAAGSAAFEAGETVNVAGASGDLDYDPETEETTAPLDVWVVDGAQLVTVETCFPDGSCARR